MIGCSVICVLRLISQNNTCYTMVHVNMVNRCMSTCFMHNLDAKNDDSALATWQVDMHNGSKPLIVVFISL